MAGVLVVEDNSAIRMMLTSGIKALGLGVPILEARSIPQARMCLQAITPDVIILDLRLPGEPGQNLIRHVRGELGQPNIPIIVASAKHNAEAEVMDLGATIFMQKPINMIDLLRAVQRFCQVTE